MSNNSAFWFANPSTGFYNGVATQSLRSNDDDSPYLYRDPSSAGNSKTFTYSCWFKRGNLAAQTNQNQPLFSAGTGATNFTMLYIDGGNDDMRWYWYNGSTDYGKAYNIKLRDTTNWYHLVWAFDTTKSASDVADRVKVYVNGTQITDIGTDYGWMGQNEDMHINTTNRQYVGKYVTNSQYLDGHLAEVNLIDGQQLTADSFGETKNGVWIPKDVSGLTYGTNGFRLTFADSSDIGNNANSTDGTNDYTPANLASTDVVPDSPENNFATLNPLGKQSASVLSEGNLKAVITSGTNSGRTPATFAVNSGKWYWEVRQSSSNRFAMGVFDTEKYVMANEDGGVDQYEWVLVTDDNSGASQLVNNSNYTSGYGGATADGHVVMVALDVDNGAIWFGKQGTWYNKGTSDNSATVKSQIEAGTTTNAAFTSVTGRLTPSFIRQTSNNTLQVNFGQDASFAGTESSATKTDENGIGAFQYDVPSGFLALCSSNLPDTTLSPAQEEQANNHFDVAEHTSTGGTSDSAGQAPTVNVTSLNFQPDWVIVKGRSYADWGETFDSNRGVNKNLQAFRNYSETDYGNTLTAFNSNGFTLGADSTAQVNWRQNNYVSWNWHCNSGSTSTNSVGSINGTQQVNTTAGYSITTFTANNNTKCTIGHGLSQAPNMVFVKNRSSSSNGQWTIGQDMYTGFTGQMYIDSGSNGTGGFSSNSGSFDNTAPTGSNGVVTLNTDNTVNEGTDSFVMYCFHSVEGYSKFGSYVGNNSTDGTFVYTGFRPAFVMCKYASGSGEDWIVWDKLRDPDNLVHNKLYWNTNNAEITDTTNRMMDFLAQGFKHRTDHVSTNGNGGTYIYMAFAEQPFKFSNAR